jgi:S1-C subfamily serine protease
MRPLLVQPTIALLAILPAMAQVPDVPPHSVLRPTVESVEGRLQAGTAFIIRLSDRGTPYLITAHHIFGPGTPYLITAHHIFGPLGGFSREYRPSELPGLIQRVLAESVDDPTASARAAGPLVLDAHPVRGQEASSDVAAIPIEDVNKAGILRLARACPAAGETVWLLAEVWGGAPRTQRLHSATVLSAGRDALLFTYDNTRLDLRATSGAPIIDSRGEVVGINVNVELRPDALVGIAVPVESIRQVLSRAGLELE